MAINQNAANSLLGIKAAAASIATGRQEAVDERLRVARGAAQELNRLRELERQAAALPELERQADLKRQVDESARELEAAKQDAARVIQNIKPMVQDWQEKYEAWRKMADELAAELKPIQDAIFQTRNGLESVVGKAVNASHRANSENDTWDTHRFGVSEATVHSKFMGEWARVVGQNDSLDCIRDFDPVAHFIMNLAKVSKVYHHKARF